MECEDLKAINVVLVRLARDIKIIKNSLQLKEDEEGELTDWAKQELEEARKTPLSEYTSLDNLYVESKNKSSS